MIHRNQSLRVINMLLGKTHSVLRDQQIMISTTVTEL